MGVVLHPVHPVLGVIIHPQPPMGVIISRPTSRTSGGITTTRRC